MFIFLEVYIYDELAEVQMHTYTETGDLKFELVHEFCNGNLFYGDRLHNALSKLSDRFSFTTYSCHDFSPQHPFGIHFKTRRPPCVFELVLSMGLEAKGHRLDNIQLLAEGTVAVWENVFLQCPFPGFTLFPSAEKHWLCAYRFTDLDKTRQIALFRKNVKGRCDPDIEDLEELKKYGRGEYSPANYVKARIYNHRFSGIDFKATKAISERFIINIHKN